MPITTTKTVSDPYAPLSWSTLGVLIALRKLKLGRSISPDESTAISRLAKELQLFSEASRIDVKKASATIPPHLRRSFCTLVAIQDPSVSTSEPLQFDRIRQDLQIIQQSVEANRANAIAPDVLERARVVCLDLLESLNKQRPKTATI